MASMARYECLPDDAIRLIMQYFRSGLQYRMTQRNHRIMIQDLKKKFYALRFHIMLHKYVLPFAIMALVTWESDYSDYWSLDDAPYEGPCFLAYADDDARALARELNRVKLLKAMQSANR